MVLTQLSPGQSARIKNMNQLARPLRRKLMVMGLLPQTEVIYLRSAPLGGPAPDPVPGDLSLHAKESGPANRSRAGITPCSAAAPVKKRHRERFRDKKSNLQSSLPLARGGFRRK